MKWNSVNKKYYENKGYVYTRMGEQFEVAVTDLTSGSHALVKVKCDSCGEILADMYWQNYKNYVHEDNKYYCQKCAMVLYGGENIRKIKLIKSKIFYQWCYDNLPTEEADEILSRWDYNLNIKNGKVLSPNDVSFSSSGFNKKGYWFKCLDHPNHEAELKSIRDFTQGKKGCIVCIQCNTIEITHPHLATFLVNKEDGLKYSIWSHGEVFLKCPDCGYEKKMRIGTLMRQGFGCPKCSDGISYPNKIMFNLLDQLQLNFKPEYSPEWMSPKRYDFYIELEDKKYIVEMDGAWHEKDNNMSGQTKEESRIIDNYKDDLAIEHDIIVIRIDSSRSELEFIKTNILNSKLAQLFNLFDINWVKCHEYACSSLVRSICDLWNSGVKNTTNIMSILKLGRGSVIRYLKQGSQLGWCDYDANITRLLNWERFKDIGGYNKKKVICLTTGEVFNSQTEAGKKYNTPSSGINRCCNGQRKSACKHPVTNESLRWMYYDEYIKLQEAN